MVLMNKGLIGASEERCSSDLFDTPVSLNDQDVASLKGAALQLRWRHFEIPGVVEADLVTPNVCDGKIPNRIRSWHPVRTFLDAPPNYAEVLDGQCPRVDL